MSRRAASLRAVASSAVAGPSASFPHAAKSNSFGCFSADISVNCSTSFGSSCAARSAGTAYFTPSHLSVSRLCQAIRSNRQPGQNFAPKT